MSRARLRLLAIAGSPVAWFVADREPCASWPDAAPGLYVAGLLVASGWRGLGIGRRALGWCVAYGTAIGLPRLRLDCHAGNSVLARVYEALGFTRRADVTRRPGHAVALYERLLSAR